ncbi:MAG: hypothetical protein R8L07_16195 [Alphaproteobacteria bacterium]|nr:hypothetical protein [Alphaproteobacteria bacterium]
MGAELNSGLSTSDMPSYVRRSFKSSHAKRVHLKAGMMLFTVSRRGNFSGSASLGGVPEFWSPYKKFKHDPGFQARAEMARTGGMKSEELFGEMSAFYGKHAGGRYAIVAKLRRSCYAFFGPIRRQGKSAAQIAAATGSAASGGGAAAPGSEKNFVGYQLYIPNLEEGADILRVRKHDLLNL